MVNESDFLVGVKLTSFNPLNSNRSHNSVNYSQNTVDNTVNTVHSAENSVDNNVKNNGIDEENKRSNIWEYIAKLERKNLCLNCERHRCRSKEVRLCEKCYKRCKRLKCIHCREEFPNHRFCKKAGQIYKRILCLNCAKNMATFNTDPRLCRYCNCWSSWRESSECDRCFRFLEKFGNPTNCEVCNKNSSFNTHNNLKLCYLCIYEFKKNDYYIKKKFKIHQTINTDSQNSTE